MFFGHARMFGHFPQTGFISEKKAATAFKTRLSFKKGGRPFNVS